MGSRLVLEKCSSDNQRSDMASTYIYELLMGLGLSRPRTLEMLPRVKVAGFDPREIIWSKGGEVASWTYVVSGLVSAGVPIREGGRIQVNIYGQRTWFGEEALLNRYPSSLEYVWPRLTTRLSITFSNPSGRLGWRKRCKEPTA